MADRVELIPLGGSVQRTDVTSPIEQIENFVPVVIGPTIGGQKQLRMVKRRGYQNRLVAPASGYSIFAGLQWTGVQGTGTGPSTHRGTIVYAAVKGGADTKLYKWDSSETTLGTFATANYSPIDIQETLISGVANLTVNVGKLISPYDQKALYFPTGGALTEITDGDFPVTNIGRFVHMDGYAFIASTDGYIYNSDVNSLANWTSTSKVAAQQQPDSLVGLARLRTNVIAAAGTNGMEFYQNAGNSSGSPLTRITQASIPYGAVNGSAMQPVGENQIVFICNGPEGVSVRMLEGFSTKPISTPFIDAVLQTMMQGASQAPLAGGILMSPAIMGVLRQHGQIGVQFSITGGPYIYWPATDVWTHATLSSGASGSSKVFAASATQLITDLSTNLVWFDEAASATTSGQDYNATNFTAYIQTPPITRGTPRMKYPKKISITGDLQTVSTPVVVSYSDDNGATFRTAGTINMNSQNAMDKGISAPNLGCYYKRIWKFSNASAGGCAIDAIWETFEVGQ